VAKRAITARHQARHRRRCHRRRRHNRNAKDFQQGAKWAIGIGIAIVVVILGSCVLGSVLFSSGGTSLAGGDSIAVIHIDDAIAGTGAYVTPEDILDQLDQALADDDVKGHPAAHRLAWRHSGGLARDSHGGKARK